jgi:hypothetical protein
MGLRERMLEVLVDVGQMLHRGLRPVVGSVDQ